MDELYDLKKTDTRKRFLCTYFVDHTCRRPRTQESALPSIPLTSELQQSLRQPQILHGLLVQPVRLLQSLQERSPSRILTLRSPVAQKHSRSNAQSFKNPVAHNTQSLKNPVAHIPSRSKTQSLKNPVAQKPGRSRTPFGRPCRQVQTYLTRTKMSTPSTRMSAKRQQSPPALRSWSGISQQGNEGESTRRRGRRRR